MMSDDDVGFMVAGPAAAHGALDLEFSTYELLRGAVVSARVPFCIQYGSN